MKKITKILMVLFAVSLLGITAGKAQVIVPSIPPFHTDHKMRQPSPQHVWIPQEWDPYAHGPHGNYMPGFWEVPPRAGLVWIPGRWKKVPKGYTWIGGHWK